MRHRWLVWVVAGTTACASALRRSESTDPTLEVRNGGPAAVELRAIFGVGAAGDTVGMLLGTVFSGRTGCFRLQSTGTPQWLKVHSVDGTYLTTRFVTAGRDAWELTLTGNLQTDRLGLEPADGRCKVGA
jgi:hypothetical protein